ncbi:MAG TPA: amidase [Mycobacteriales bacterium]|nr:amidase [Mycobacteriales bacterium]
MTTFITKLDATGSGPRLAVKDLIDVAGVPTTAGSRAVERTAKPAAADAPCLAGARAADARIVGKVNLQELAMLPFGTNPWFGTPVNPLDPALIPGGSSSGSATAVAYDDADVALGSDTGGSVRVPSACCGMAGLKTTYGRVSLEGVWPLAPSFDTIGPMATTVAGLVRGMELLEPGFAAAPSAASTVGRLRTNGDPLIEAAVDNALREAGFTVVDLDYAPIAAAADLWTPIYFAEIVASDGQLVADNPDAVGEDIAGMIGMSPAFTAEVDTVRVQLEQWRESVLRLFDQVELLALPTLPIFPPRIDAITPDTLVSMAIEITAHVTPFNAAGTPCTAQPIRTDGSAIPASLQMVGPLGGEELLLTTARVVEEAAGAR